MTSGTLGWNTRPSTMPTTSAAIPIMPARSPSAPVPGGSPSAGLLSLGPNLFGELDIPYRSGGQGQTVAGVDAHADTVGGLQQPKTVQTGAAVEVVLHRVRRPDREDRVGAGGGVVVDQDRSAGLPDRHVGADPGAVDRDRLRAAGPQRVDDELQVAV